MKIVLAFLIIFNFAFSKELTLGIVPQQSPLKLAQKWIKITKYLSAKTGLKIVFKTENSIPAFEKKLYSGKYDFSYMNPYHFIKANKAQKYIAKIRANKHIKGILVSKDKKLDINKLKNSTFLFPAPKAFAATLLTKFELKERYNFDIEKDAKYIYVNSHDSVYKGVARDIGQYGGGIIRTFNNFNDLQDKEKIYIVYTTKAYPSHPIAFNPKVPQDIQNKIVEAFLKMPKELLDILSIKKFIKTDNEEYSIIKRFK